ncbi:hypothetical protein K474DRAFT_1112489 [Panus rudis PR-1116 ss-1]|nr:hypothetical protein K474DRAFT_1112489 [Panus rudis PR-1116 ss-1]
MASEIYRGATTLPPAFTSLYRLFIRSTATAVLNQSRSTRVLRKLYRPSFEEAAIAIRQLENQSLPAKKRADLTTWISKWQERVDNTLLLLANSSQKRGLPSDVIKRLVRTKYRNEKVGYLGPARKTGRKWNPRLNANSPEYDPERSPHTKRVSAAVAAQARFEDEAFNAMGEAVKMAEARSKLILGRICIPSTS